MSSMLNNKPLTIKMPTHNVIDVTLRDGGFRNNFNWAQSESNSIYEACCAAGTEWIELGYIGGLPAIHSADGYGKFADLKPADIIKLAPRKSGCHQSRLAVMVHPSAKGTAVGYDEFKDAGVELVRVVYHPSWEQSAFLANKKAKDAGLMTAINIALVSRYDKNHLAEISQVILNEQPNILYFADTCGALEPNDVLKLFQSHCSEIETGFHAHDFLSLAVANSLSAIRAGCKWIDISLLGMGRGAGNTRAETWIALRERAGQNAIPTSQILKATKCIEKNSGTAKIPDLVSIISGARNLTPLQEDEIRENLEILTNSYCPSSLTTKLGKT